MVLRRFNLDAPGVGESGSNKTVFLNASSLLVIQIANQLLPLILIPFLARALGAGTYGVVSFGTGMVLMATIVTDYGFNLSATLQISKKRDDYNYVNRLIGAVFLCKAILLCLVLPITISYALLTEKYAEFSSFLLMLTFPLAMQTFQPVWFFQGIERMAQIALFTLASRIVYVLLVFALVRQPADFLWLAIANGVSQAAALALAIILMFKAGYRPVWPGIRFAVEVARNSTPFFWSRAAVSTYTAGGAVFLGLFSTPTQVGYYAAAEQIYRGAQGLFAPLSQALYPNMVRTRNFALLFKVTFWATGLTIVGAICGVVLGPIVISVLFGHSFSEAAPILVVFLLTLSVNTPSVLIGYPLLGALGHASAANKSVFIAGALQVVALFICYVNEWTAALYIAITVLVVEAVVLLIRVKLGRKYYLSDVALKLT